MLRSSIFLSTQCTLDHFFLDLAKCPMPVVAQNPSYSENKHPQSWHDQHLQWMSRLKWLSWKSIGLRNSWLPILPASKLGAFPWTPPKVWSSSQHWQHWLWRRSYCLQREGTGCYSNLERHILSRPHSSSTLHHLDLAQQSSPACSPLGNGWSNYCTCPGLSHQECWQVGVPPNSILWVHESQDRQCGWQTVGYHRISCLVTCVLQTNHAAQHLEHLEHEEEIAITYQIRTNNAHVYQH